MKTPPPGAYTSGATGGGTKGGAAGGMGGGSTGGIDGCGNDGGCTGGGSRGGVAGGEGGVEGASLVAGAVSGINGGRGDCGGGWAGGSEGLYANVWPVFGAPEVALIGPVHENSAFVLPDPTSCSEPVEAALELSVTPMSVDVRPCTVVGPLAAVVVPP
eukprot:7384222-Prymnesium_polylepis.6